ncbi:hypothetical protein GGR50DRAFT_693182 [Xylaria sp. CBS 124048]|nr:hypothetical protein GGR50DRAFT_693182 [Xylaria sp. CBS 124048]
MAASNLVSSVSNMLKNGIPESPVAKGKAEGKSCWRCAFTIHHTRACYATTDEDRRPLPARKKPTAAATSFGKRSREDNGDAQPAPTKKAQVDVIDLLDEDNAMQEAQQLEYFEEPEDWDSDF